MGESEYIKIEDGLFKKKNHHYLIKTCEYCNNEFFCRKDKLKTKKTCNSICYQNLIELSKKYEIDDYVNDIIIGSLLSDGTICNHIKMKNNNWSHTSTNENYIDYIISETKIHLHKFSTESKEFTSSVSGKIYKSKKSFSFKSKSSISFTRYRKTWYPYGTKVVPNTIELTPTVLLHWYIGDGNIRDNIGITLCTDSFDEISILFLMQKLQQLNFEPYLYETKNRIVIPNKRVFEFLKYIGNCPVKGFEYKWNTKIRESYIDRICLKCGEKFNAIYNHQKYCTPNCAKNYSRDNNYKLKSKKSNQPSVL